MKTPSRPPMILSSLCIFFGSISLLSCLALPMMFDAPHSGENPYTWISCLTFLALPFSFFSAPILSKSLYSKQKEKPHRLLPFLIPVINIILLIIPNYFFTTFS